MNWIHLVPIKDKPIIEHIIENFQKNNISNFFVTVNFKSRILKAFFDEFNPDVNIKFIDEEKPLGTAASLNLLVNKLRKPFFVTNCDIILKTDIQKIYYSHLTNNNDLTMVLIKQKEKLAYGSCKISKNGNLKSIEEKPETTYLINSGVYLFKKSILDIIPKNKKIHFNQFVKDALKKNYKIGTYTLEEKNWIDIGNWLSYKSSIDKFSF